MSNKTCMGAGIFNLDIVASKEGKELTTIIEEVGGTCGNVMAILAHMGCHTYPVARLDDSAFGQKIADDLRNFGCDTTYVTNSADGGTTLLNVVHKTDKDGNHKVSVRASGPQGGRFPNYRFILKERAQQILDTISFTPDVFFFDSPNAGHRILAEGLGVKGTLVYFEPGTSKGNDILKSIEVSHIVKFSDETIADLSFLKGFHNKLFIQTMGANGIRFKLKDNEWIHLPAVKNDKAVDWEGAGDWTTSTFINYLMSNGHLDIDTLTVEIVTNALNAAQAMASQSVSYMGSKGLIHAQRK